MTTLTECKKPAHWWVMEPCVDGVTPAKCKYCKAKRTYIDPDLIPPAFNNRMKQMDAQARENKAHRPFTGRKQQPATGLKRETTHTW